MTVGPFYVQLCGKMQPKAGTEPFCWFANLLLSLRYSNAVALSREPQQKHLHTVCVFSLQNKEALNSVSLLLPVLQIWGEERGTQIVGFPSLSHF